MAHAHFMPDKAKERHSEHAIIIDFPPQQWLRERASFSRYTNIAVLVVRY
jgi:hypothetical protein